MSERASEGGEGGREGRGGEGVREGRGGRERGRGGRDGREAIRSVSGLTIVRVCINILQFLPETLRLSSHSRF